MEKKKNQAAVRLGRLAAGKPKKYSAAEIKRRTAQLLANRYTPEKKEEKEKIPA